MIISCTVYRKCTCTYIIPTYIPTHSHTHTAGETRIVFSKLEAPQHTPELIQVGDVKSTPQPSVAVGETVTLKKAEPSTSDKQATQDSKTSPAKEPSSGVEPSDSWVMVKSETDTQANRTTSVETTDRMPSDKEKLSDQPPPADGAGKASDKQAWNRSSNTGREASSARVTQPRPTAPSGDGSVEGRREGIEVEDIEEKEEEKGEGVGGGEGNLIFSFGDEPSAEKFSTPSASTPQVRGIH